MASRAKAYEPEPEPEFASSVEAGIENGVEHLQTAAHEMVAAARAFLDVVEDVVSDREKLSAAAAAVTDLLGTAGSSLAKVAERVSGAADHAGRRAASDPPPRRIRRIDVD